MSVVKKKRRSWKDVHDEFSDLPVTRQRKWQLRMRKEGRCGTCGRNFINGRCPSGHLNNGVAYRQKWRVIGPCVANMLRAGMTINEVAKDMNMSRVLVMNTAKRYGVDVSSQKLRVGRPSGATLPLNLGIFLKQSLNGNRPSPLKALD